MEHGLSTAPEQKQEQSQILSPRMLQSLSVLQMPSAELYDYLVQEIEENPVIAFDSIDYAERVRRTAAAAAGEENGGDPMDAIADDVNSPSDSLKLQFSMLRSGRDIEKLGMALIDMLDDGGFLSREDFRRFKENPKVSREDADRALKLLRSLEPPGVGAFDLRESLLLQLERRGLEKSDAYTVADRCLELLGKNQLPQIAKQCSMSLSRVIDAWEIIRSLNPRPLSGGGGYSKREYIIPDIRIFRRDKGYAVELNQLNSDSITVDSQYVQIMRQTESEAVREYLDESIKKANILRDSIRQRCETLMLTASALLAAQRAFFENGTGNLVPYSRKEMAEQLGVSESTVSRAFSGKYIECDWGIFPADYFFPKPPSGNGDALSRDAVLSAIKDIVARENRAAPLSDEDIAAKLKSRQVEVSRRTVAKYRDILGIPSSSKRRVYTPE